jgi:hypothetical protein
LARGLEKNQKARFILSPGSLKSHFFVLLFNAQDILKGKGNKYGETLISKSTSQYSLSTCYLFTIVGIMDMGWRNPKSRDTVFEGGRG